MINQAREILPLGQTVRILNICAEEPAVATTFKLPLSRNTSAGRPVAPDTAPLVRTEKLRPICKRIVHDHS